MKKIKFLNAEGVAAEKNMKRNNCNNILLNVIAIHFKYLFLLNLLIYINLLVFYFYFNHHKRLLTSSIWRNWIILQENYEIKRSNYEVPYTDVSKFVIQNRLKNILDFNSEKPNLKGYITYIMFIDTLSMVDH